MDRNQKIGISIAGFLIGMGVRLGELAYKRFSNLEKRLEILDEMVDNVTKIQDIEFQKEIDVRFDDIADNFDE